MLLLSIAKKVHTPLTPYELVVFRGHLQTDFGMLNVIMLNVIMTLSVIAFIV